MIGTKRLAFLTGTVRAWATPAARVGGRGTTERPAAAHHRRRPASYDVLPLEPRTLFNAGYGPGVGPSVPTNLAAAPAPHGAVVVSWSASEEDGAFIAGYEVLRDGINVGFVPAAAQPRGFTDAGPLAPGSTHTYAVVAADASGDASDPAAITVTLPAVPDAPTGLSERPISAHAMYLRWIDRSTDETAFRVQESTDGVHFHLAKTVKANSSATVVRGLALGTRYAFRVRSYNAFAGRSAPADVAAAVATSSQDTNGYYKVSLGGPSWTHGDANFGTAGGGLDVKSGQARYIWASSWQDAVMRAVEGTASVSETGATYTFGTDNAFLVQDHFSFTPAGGTTQTIGRAITLEDLTYQPNNDNDSNDDYVPVSVERGVRLAWTTDEGDQTPHAFWIPLSAGNVTPQPDNGTTGDPLGDSSVSVDYGDGSDPTDGTAPQFFDDEGHYDTAVTSTDLNGGTVRTTFSIDVSDPADPIPPIDVGTFSEEYQGSASSNSPTTALPASVTAAPANAPSVPPPLFTYVGVLPGAYDNAAVADFISKYQADPRTQGAVFIGLANIVITAVPNGVIWTGHADFVPNVEHDGAGNAFKSGGYASAQAFLQQVAANQGTGVQDLGQGSLLANLQDGASLQLDKNGDWGTLTVTRTGATTIEYRNAVREVDLENAAGACGNVDEVDYKLSTLIEDKDATGLLNPMNKKPDGTLRNTEANWARQHIFKKGQKLIDGLTVATTTQKSVDPTGRRIYVGPDTPPTLAQLRAARLVQFRVKGNWPELQAAVLQEVQNLTNTYGAAGWLFLPPIFG